MQSGHREQELPGGPVDQVLGEGVVDAALLRRRAGDRPGNPDQEIAAKRQIEGEALRHFGDLTRSYPPAPGSTARADSIGVPEDDAERSPVPRTPRTGLTNVRRADQAVPGRKARFPYANQRV